MPTFTARSEQIFEEAAEWVVEVRNGGARPPGGTQFIEWLRRSPEHVAAYFEMAAVWEDVPRLIPLRSVDVDALVESARSELDAPPERAPPHLRLAAWASVLMVCIGLAAAWWLWPHAQTYVTQIGEQRSITLEDGSTVELDTKSRIRVRLAKEVRRIELLEGQALFHVAPDVRRPFVVSCYGTRVRAVGTQFDVYRKASGMKIVTVVEGHVSMLAGAGGQEIPLGPGDQASVTVDGTVQARAADAKASTAWTQRTLIFHGTQLGEVVAELNRYNRKPTIIDDASLQAVRINGVFSSTDPTSLLLFLRAQLQVFVRETDTAIHIGKAE